MIPSGIAPQFTTTISSFFLLLNLWIALATTSFPVPDSPVTSTDMSTGEICIIISNT